MSISVIGQLPHKGIVPRRIEQAAKNLAYQQLLFGREKIAGDNGPRHLPMIGGKSAEQAALLVVMIPFKANFTALGLA